MEENKIKIQDRVIEKYLEEGKTICYYPSCGFRDTRIFNLPFDVILLSDYIDFKGKRRNKVNSNQEQIESHLYGLINFMHGEMEKKIEEEESYIVFQANYKIFIFYFEDNRNVRNRLIEQGIKLDGFIIHNDGCMEGGNYECVTNGNWTNEMEKIYKDSAVIVKDHDSGSYHPIEIRTYDYSSSHLTDILSKIFIKNN
jgi:hypothetical protein